MVRKNAKASSCEVSRASISLAPSCSPSFVGLLNGGLLMVARLGQGEVSQRLEMTDVPVRDEGSRFLFHRFIFSHVKLSRAGMKKNRLFPIQQEGGSETYKHKRPGFCHRGFFLNHVEGLNSQIHLKVSRKSCSITVKSL